MSTQNKSTTGIFSGTITDTISALLGGLTVAFTKFTKWGIELGKVEEAKGVTQVPLKLPDGDVFYIKYKYTNEDKTQMKIKVEDESGKNIIRKNVIVNTPEDYMKTVMEMLKEGWDILPEDLQKSDASNSDDQPIANDDTTTDLVVQSKRIRATLQRICGGTEGDTINLVRICGSYDADEMSTDLAAVLESPEVLDTIGEEPVSIEIVDNGQDFDVNECELSESDCLSQSCVTLLKCGYRCLHNLQAIHWNAKGDKFDEIHRGSDNFIWSVRNKIDQIAELAVQLTGHVEHPAILMQGVDSSLNTQSGFEGEEALKMIYDEVMSFKACIELHICNFADDVQTMMNMWVRDMNHEVGYLLGRRLEGTDVAPGAVPVPVSDITCL